MTDYKFWWQDPDFHDKQQNLLLKTLLEYNIPTLKEFERPTNGGHAKKRRADLAILWPEIHAVEIQKSAITLQSFIERCEDWTKHIKIPVHWIFTDKWFAPIAWDAWSLWDEKPTWTTYWSYRKTWEKKVGILQYAASNPDVEVFFWDTKKNKNRPTPSVWKLESISEVHYSLCPALKDQKGIGYALKNDLVLRAEFKYFWDYEDYQHELMHYGSEQFHYDDRQWIFWQLEDEEDPYGPFVLDKSSYYADKLMEKYFD